MNSNQVVIHINTPAVPRQEYLSVRAETEMCYTLSNV